MAYLLCSTYYSIHLRYKALLTNCLLLSLFRLWRYIDLPTSYWYLFLFYLRHLRTGIYAKFVFFFIMAANINKCNHCLGKCNKIQGLNMLSNPVILILELRDKIQAFLSCIYLFIYFFERVTFFWMWIWNIYFQIQYIVFLYLDLLTLFKMSNVYLKVFFFFFWKLKFCVH